MLLLLILTAPVISQSDVGSPLPTIFSYQGNLTVSGAPANGAYDIQLALFDAFVGGTQLALSTQLNVPVTNGLFTAAFNFGTQFNGEQRFIEVRVKPVGGSTYTTLLSRQPVLSTPQAVYSITSQTAATATNATTANNALNLGGLAANQYVLTGDARLSDARPPTAGSANYIQNQDSAPQPSARFSISGNGFVGGTLRGNVVNTLTHYNVNGSRVLFTDNAGLNTFVGVNSGVDNSTGTSNSFFGRQAGFQNTTGSDNSFFGSLAGNGNVGGSFNAFFGRGAGSANNTGSQNTFVGNDADFTGPSVGGDRNTLLGSFARVTSGLDNATAIGARATVTQGNSLVLGSVPGVNGATANVNVGIGTTAPSALLDIATNGGNVLFGDANCAATTTVAIGLNGAFGNCLNYTLRGTDNDVYINRPTGGAIVVREGNGSTQFAINAGGTVDVRVLGTTGGTALCRNADQEIAFCSSSLRYKKNVAPFAPGLSFASYGR